MCFPSCKVVSGGMWEAATADRAKVVGGATMPSVEDEEDENEWTCENYDLVN